MTEIEKLMMGIRFIKCSECDRVEVVRCKDCKWLYDEPDDYCCTNHKGLVVITPNSFCSHGERKVDQTCT